ncbi:MAG: MBL fold metallo-hydrolase [Candidatus Hydrogenedentes bacterium]|nr:MBL fold metallo-hydrolase [Candidatus Hydrogenedentota bacterium]
MEILEFVTTPLMENCIVVKDGDEAIVIDPGEATQELLDAIEGLTVKFVVNTHAHFDHVGGNAAILERTGAELLCHRDCVEMLKEATSSGEKYGKRVDESPAPDRLLEEGDTVSVGSVTMKVVYVPGHAPGHIALIGDGFAIVGDVLFAGSIGRTDFPGGSHQMLLDSIKSKLLPLPDETVVFCGHGPSTTIGMERRSNPFLVSL